MGLLYDVCHLKNTLVFPEGIDGPIYECLLKAKKYPDFKPEFMVNRQEFRIVPERRAQTSDSYRLSFDCRIK